MISEVIYSSRTEEWPTPRTFFDQLDAEFHFTLDPCATAENAKCATFYTKEETAIQDWGKHVVFCNPPYGKAIGCWARKCFDASLAGQDIQ